MGIVNAERLNSHMSSPRWNDRQYEEAERLCVELEDELADLLNTRITPVPYRETATILDTGLVATSYPVFAVTELAGTVIPEDGTLPDGWILREHRVRREPMQLGVVGLTLTGPLGGFGGGPAARIQGSGAVQLAYQAGWGDESTLRKAILTKATAIMTNRHDDTVVARNLDATAPPPLQEEWTAKDLEPVQVYRNLMVFR